MNISAQIIFLYTDYTLRTILDVNLKYQMIKRDHSNPLQNLYPSAYGKNYLLYLHQSYKEVSPVEEIIKLNFWKFKVENSAYASGYTQVRVLLIKHGYSGIWKLSDHWASKCLCFGGQPVYLWEGHSNKKKVSKAGKIDEKCKKTI